MKRRVDAERRGFSQTAQIDGRRRLSGLLRVRGSMAGPGLGLWGFRAWGSGFRGLGFRARV